MGCLLLLILPSITNTFWLIFQETTFYKNSKVFFFFFFLRNLLRIPGYMTCDNNKAMLKCSLWAAGRACLLLIFPGHQPPGTMI